MFPFDRVGLPALASSGNLGEFAKWLVDVVWSTPLFFLLLGCGLTFSIATKFAQWRILTHGFACIRGKYDDPNDPGAISHFQALCAALSATVGLGNIAGVAVAVSLGGPGAVFWMWVVGLFGMALKFAECSLAVMYRDVRDVPDPGAPALMEADAESRSLEYRGEPPPPNGTPELARGEVRGGPMWYMQRALVDPLRAKGSVFWPVFKILAVFFSVATVLNSFGGGNMFQGWNVSNVLKTNFGLGEYVSAAVVSVLVAMVIIGGIKRIGQVASKLVPIMCVLYVLGACIIIFKNLSDVPYYLRMILSSAFRSSEAEGAFAGVSVWLAFTWGLRRACFSNEAGEGSAAMAHAAAKTDEPIREGIVAGIGPFVDTLVICTMSALVILMTGVWSRPTVGVVASVSDDVVTVSVTNDLTARYREAYIREIVTDRQPSTRLGVHLKEKIGAAPEQVRLAVDRVVPAEAASWSDVRSIVLAVERSANAEDERDALRAKLKDVEPGMAVHIDLDGAEMMRFAFDTGMAGMGKWIISLGVCLFAFSTMISWSYYGEKGAEYLFGPGAILPYKFVFIVFVFLGMVIPKFQTVYDFSDATSGMMVLCNLPAVLFLAGRVVSAARSYFRRLDAGEFRRFK